jgi:murein DD-endopeptidase MepM/ murein hydrolase activator NlpD
VSPPDVPARPTLPALLASAALAAIVVVAGLGALGLLRPPLPDLPPPPVAAVGVPAPPPAIRSTSLTARLARRETIGQALLRMQATASEVTVLVAAMKDRVPVRKARPGDQLRLERAEDGSVTRLTFRQGRADEWVVQRTTQGPYEAHKRPVELTTVVERAEVTIASSLYESMAGAGQDPILAVLAADVLAWDVDFYQDVRTGDHLRLVVERVLADGAPLRYGEVLAAEYEGEATGTRRLFRWVDPDGRPGYYDDSGQSAQRGFLRSPLKYAHLTSRFGSRRHPVLGYTRAHEGVDYGAPAGTPVWAVGDGTVRQAGWNGGCGKSVTLRHRNGYETVYCHLSGVAVSAGRGVTQKQVIGWVGATGLATGPHLHYAVRKAGRFMNPLALRVPREAPVRAEWLETFRTAIGPLQARLRGDSIALN